MRRTSILTLTTTLLIALLAGCGSDNTPEQKTATENNEEGGMVQLGRADTCDQILNGIRVVMAYDSLTNAFRGTVDNMNYENLSGMRMEIYLSNGSKLGPTGSIDLDPGQKRNISIGSASTHFEYWSIHPLFPGDEQDGG